MLPTCWLLTAVVLSTLSFHGAELSWMHHNQERLPSGCTQMSNKDWGTLLFSRTLLSLDVPKQLLHVNFKKPIFAADLLDVFDLLAIQNQ